MDDFELVEVVGALLGKTRDDIAEMHNDCGLVEDMLCEWFDVDTETFRYIATALLKLCPVIETAATGTKYHVFVNGGVALARAKANI